MVKGSWEIREKMFPRVCAEINLDHVIENAVHMKAHVSQSAKLMPVIKTDAYGHGSIPIAKSLEGLSGIFGFCVATVEEALLLRNAEIKLPILVLGYTFSESYELLCKEEIRPAVFREDMIEALSEAALNMGKRIKVHIKVDTGMNRIGITPDAQGLSFIRRAALLPGIEIEGIFTHFARADEMDKTSALSQLNTFCRFVEHAEELLGYQIPVHHCSNSAGIIELSDANMDVVRPGIILYGLRPSFEVREDVIELKPLLSLLSHVVFIKRLNKGQSVSYGGTFTAPKDMLIATVPVGYGDGYPRALSNKGYVLIRGKKAPILGRVCMDQFMVDVTEISDVEVNDIVTLIGIDGEACITVEELGELSGRFNYELICDLGVRIPRVYLRNGNVVAYRAPYEKETVWL